MKISDAQKIFLWITVLLPVVIIVGSAVLVCSMAHIEIPATPTLSVSGGITAQEAKQLEISNYKDLVAALQAQKTNIFDYAILQSLLPLFSYLIAAVITYVFADNVLETYKIYLRERNK